LDVTRGFVSNLCYNDGVGSYSESGWGQHSWDHEKCTIYGEEFGLNERFEDTPKFRDFLNQNYVEEIHEEKRMEIVKDFKLYSDFYKNDFIAKENALSYSFWYFVYNDDAIKQSQLKNVLKMEQNPKILKLLDDAEYVESISMVYDKLNFFNTSKKHSFWFIFWHDLWMNNMMMPIFVNNEDLLSPFSATSLCYKYIESKEELIQMLQEKALYAPHNKIRKGWINSIIIDLLYKKLDHFSDDINHKENDDKIIQINQQKRRSTTIPLSPFIDDDNKSEDDHILKEYLKTSKIIKTICEEPRNEYQQNDEQKE